MKGWRRGGAKSGKQPFKHFDFMKSQCEKRSQGAWQRRTTARAFYPVIDVQLQAFMYFWSDVFLRVFFFSKVSPPRHHPKTMSSPK